MAAGKVTYAKVGGPPENWRGITVIDLDTGKTVPAVLEVNTEEGWVFKHKLDERGSGVVDYSVNPPVLATERITGRFEIRVP